MSACGEQQHAGTVRGTNVIVRVGDGRGLARSAAFSFQRPLSRVFDLNNSALFYYIQGPPAGEAELSYVLGPKGGPSLTCDCDTSTLIIGVTPGQCASPSVTYTMLNAMGVALTGQVTSDDFMFQIGIKYQFTDLETST